MHSSFGMDAHSHRCAVAAHTSCEAGLFDWVAGALAMLYVDVFGILPRQQTTACVRANWHATVSSAMTHIAPQLWL